VGSVEPYARPASPPPPPVVTAGVAGVGGGGVSGVSGASGVGASAGGAAVSAPTTAAALNKISTANSTPSTATKSKKKSRWASADPAGEAEEEEEENNGKSPASALGSVEKKAVAERSKHLYLNKFVQEKSSKSSIEGTGKNIFETHSVQSSATASASIKDSITGGTKRKRGMDRYDSNLSANDSYYGPPSSSSSSSPSLASKPKASIYGPAGVGRTSSFGAGGSSSIASRDKEDYMPLGLDRPLGSTKKLSKSPARNKKAKGASSNNSGGFEKHDSILSERAHRFKGKGGIFDVASAKSTVSQNVEKYMGKTTIGGSKKRLDEQDYERMTVKGTCTTLEKEYLRLTSPPRAELVRPQPILEQHLRNLQQSYYQNKKVHLGRARDYNWYCSQFKAMRQDLTVQRIVNAFSVEVYETHARVALEEDDINEYNQSQTQLKELYDAIDGGRGSNVVSNSKQGKKKHNLGKQQRKDEKERVENRTLALKNRNEFIAYRIIYYVFLSGNRKYEGGSSDIFKIMLQLTPEQQQDKCIHHALLVRAAVAEADYHKFFQLQDVAPNMSDYLMDKIVPSVRQGALQRICKSYRPSVSANFVLKELGFDIQDRNEVEGGRAWMERCGCKFDGDVLLTKDTVLKESVGGVKNSLI